MRSRHSRGTRASATALAVSQEVAKYVRLPHARRVVLAVVGLRAIGTHRTGERSLSLGSKQWCDVRVVISNAKPGFAWHTRTRHCAGCLPGGGELRKLVACVPCRAACKLAAHYGLSRHRRGASLLRCKTVVRRASCDLQRVAGIGVAHTHAPLRWLSLGRWRNTRPYHKRAVPRWL